MPAGSIRNSTVRFGPFEVDLTAGELCKNGVRMKLQDQPFLVLVALLERPGEVVTREEFRQRLWADDTFVDFDNSLSTAINKIREALDDSARHPRFVETVPRRGYRWIGEVPASPDAEESDSQRPHRRAWWYAASAVVVISLIAAAVGFSFRNRREPGPATQPEFKAQQLTSLIGVENWPTLSPDGSHVAFVWNGKNQDNADIYVQTIGSGNTLRLTDSEEPDLYPAWSPDGRTIAFQRRAADGNHGIYLAPPFGGPERKVGTAEGYGLSWSPDSRWLVISDRESLKQAYALQLLSIDTGERRALTSPIGRSAQPYISSALSPDGRSLAYFEIGEGLLVLNLNSDLSAAGEPRRISATPSGIPGGVAWTADGAELVVSSTPGPRRRWLRRVKADGSAPATQLEFSDQAGDGVALSPPTATHGGRLVFSRGSIDVNIYRLDLSVGRQEARPFAPSTLTEDSPQFSPDGTRVAFASNRTDNLGTQIWVCQADGSNAVQLTFCEDGSCGSPRWSPDGKWIVFDRRSQQEAPGIHVVSSEGGPSRRLMKDPAPNFLPSWSVDGNWIYFCSRRSGEDQIWKIPAAGGSAAQVTRGGGRVAFESPDGASVYFSKLGQTSPLWKIPVSGGAATEVLQAVFHRNFVVTKSGIWHVVEVETYEAEIRFLDFSSGKTRVVHQMDGPASYALTVSPDENSILFVQADQTSSDLMLVENFQ